MKNNSFPLLLVTFGLTSCAYTTSSEVTSADRYLKGNCKEAYLSTRTSASSDGFGYQYHRYRVRAFAVANYGDKQVCSWWHGPWSSSQSHANLMAVDDCNRRLPRGLKCVVYAEGDRIINAPPNYSAFIQTIPNNSIIQSKPIPAQNTEPEKLINEAQDLKKRQSSH